MRPSLRLLAILACVALGMALSPPGVSARVHRPAGSVARLVYAPHGVRIQPPHAAARNVRAEQWLYPASALSTGPAQQASLRYPDATILNVNVRSRLRLTSAGITRLAAGEVEQRVTPGTQHLIVTPAGSALAIGTDFDVAFRGTSMTVTVVEGAVVVSSIRGSVLAKTGQAVTFQVGSAPAQPVPTDTRAAVSWSSSIPRPHNGPSVNIALDANGGRVEGASPARPSPSAMPGEWSVSNLIDGRLDRGWQTGPGAIKNQFAVLSFAGGSQYTVDAVALDCAPTGGQPAGDELKDFDVRVSGDLKSLASFKTVYSSACRQGAGLQIFRLRNPVMTRFLMLYCKSNWGGSDGIAVAEMEVISPDRIALVGSARSQNGRAGSFAASA